MSAYRNRIVVVGGGPVGLAAALGLARVPGLDVISIERERTMPWEAPAGFDHRVYALSPTSIDWLVSLGVQFDSARRAPVHAMHVWGDAPERGLVFEDGAALAFIVEYGALMQALRHACARVSERARLIEGVTVVAMRDSPAGRVLDLDDGRQIQADLVIAADGARSALRDMAGLVSHRHDYAADGIVANFACERPHGDVARQWFFGASILALLPLPGSRVSIVWSMPRDEAAACAQQGYGDRTLAAAVEAACGSALGTMTPISAVARFPLARVTAPDWVAPQFALIGDAAHAVHPLAGQGVNLGFGDAMSLVRHVAQRSRFSSPGDVVLLRAYERERREAALATGELTHQLQALFKAPGGFARALRNRGLALLDGLPAIKARMVRYAVG
jgi:ubiquinone biosynthesis UbiH/UbiF/VisC/COQ6 family hydroxylase